MASWTPTAAAIDAATEAVRRVLAACDVPCQQSWELNMFPAKIPYFPCFTHRIRTFEGEPSKNPPSFARTEWRAEDVCGEAEGLLEAALAKRPLQQEAAGAARGLSAMPLLGWCWVKKNECRAPKGFVFFQLLSYIPFILARGQCRIRIGKHSIFCPMYFSIHFFIFKEVYKTG